MILKNIITKNIYPISIYTRTIAGSLILFVIAHYLSVYDYGLFSSYKAIAGFCFIFANMGFCEYILVSSKANLKEVKLKISLFMLNALFIMLFSILVSQFFSIERHLLFILVLFRTFFDSVFFALILPFFQASNKLQTISKINIIYGLGITIIAIVSYIFKLSLVKFLILNITLGFINFIQCSYFAKINYFLVFKYIKRFFLKLDKTIFSYIGVHFANIITSQLTSLFVSIILIKEQAALYFAAFTIANFITLLNTAQFQKILPEFINNSASNIRKLIKHNLNFILLVTGVMLAFFLIFGKLLLKLLYGQDYYLNAYPILILFIIANIFTAVGEVYGVYITSSNNEKYKVLIRFQAGLITLVSLALLRKFGIYGATISFLLTSICLAILHINKSLQLLKQQEQQENIKENLWNSKN